MEVLTYVRDCAANTKPGACKVQPATESVCPSECSYIINQPSDFPRSFHSFLFRLFNDDVNVRMYVPSSDRVTEKIWNGNDSKEWSWHNRGIIPVSVSEWREGVTINVSHDSQCTGRYSNQVLSNTSLQCYPCANHYNGRVRFEVVAAGLIKIPVINITPCRLVKFMDF